MLKMRKAFINFSKSQAADHLEKEEQILSQKLNSLTVNGNEKDKTSPPVVAGEQTQEIYFNIDNDLDYWFKWQKDLWRARRRDERTSGSWQNQSIQLERSLGPLKSMSSLQHGISFRFVRIQVFTSFGSILKMVSYFLLK